MHGTVMMFLFAIPLFEGLAVYLLPKMLGTRDLAFPRLTAYGFWCYVFGGTMLLLSLLAGVAPDSGWFMYPPLSSTLGSPGINPDFWLIGHHLRRDLGHRGGGRDHGEHPQGPRARHEPRARCRSSPGTRSSPR
jgi:heme/copper-type cytochrome/quinol oxidase subunit 1